MVKKKIEKKKKVNKEKRKEKILYVLRTSSGPNRYSNEYSDPDSTTTSCYPIPEYPFI